MPDARKSHAKDAVRRTTGRDVEVVLREMFVEKRATKLEIARAIGVHRQTVALWLAEYGISEDDREPVSL